MYIHTALQPPTLPETVFNLYNNTQNNREIRVKYKKTHTQRILSSTKETEKVPMWVFFRHTENPIQKHTKTATGIREQYNIILYNI